MTGLPVAPALGELIDEAVGGLAAAGVATPRYDAEAIACFALGKSRAELALACGSPVGDQDVDRLRILFGRRVLREPLQHIVGSVTFRWIEIRSDRRALVPRPETELLAGLAVDRAAEIARSGRSPKVADIGTGSGAVALSIAVEVPEAQLWGTDLSDAALSLARENRDLLGLEGRVGLRRGDLFEALPRHLRECVDVIVSNPPYVAFGEMSELPPEVREFDPALALCGGSGGDSVAVRIAEEARDWLSPGGMLAIEVGPSQWAGVAEVAARTGLEVQPPACDLNGRERFVVAHRFKNPTAGLEFDTDPVGGHL